MKHISTGLIQLLFISKQRRIHMKVQNLLKSFLVAVLLVSTLFVTNGFPSDPYPNRPITIVWGWGPGGGGDLIVRAFCRAAEKVLSQPIINENKAGGSGVIGINYVSNSKPDGYTLGATSPSPLIIQPNMRKTPYDPFTFVDICSFAAFNFGLSVRADAPWNSFEEVIEYARKNPGKFRYGNAGTGTSQHICMERIALKEGIKWTQIPFKSGAEPVIALLGGHVDGCIQDESLISGHIKAGKMKLLLSFSKKRWTKIPNVRSILELKGYDFFVISQISIFGPKGMPEDVRQKLESSFKKASRDPTFREALEELSFEGDFMTGKEYSDLWRSRYDEMGKILNTLGLVEK